MSDVKSQPRQARRDRAKMTRARIVRCAYELFCENGYPTTTMETIAAAAGVATQTVYYTFRTKAQLLREVIDSAAAGEPDAAPVMQRPWMTQALAETDPRRAIALVVEHGVDIYARVAPLSAAVRTAASLDPDVETHWRQITAGRRHGMAQFIAAIAERGYLRSGLTPHDGADIMFVVNSHETFLGFTRDCGWTIEDFKTWLYATLCKQLLPRPVGNASRPATPQTHGLTYHQALAPVADSQPHRGTNT